MRSKELCVLYPDGLVGQRQEFNLGGYSGNIQHQGVVLVMDADAVDHDAVEQSQPQVLDFHLGLYLLREPCRQLSCAPSLHGRNGAHGQQQ